MSQANVERLRSAFEAFLAGDSEFGAELLDPDGLIVHWKAFMTQSEALEAAGQKE